MFNVTSSKLTGIPQTRLLPLGTVASAIGVNPALVRRLTREGVIPSVQLGARRRVDERWLRTWLDRGLGPEGTPAAPVDSK